VRRTVVAFAAIIPLAFGLSAGSPAAGATPPGAGDVLRTWDAKVGPGQVPALIAAGVDSTELRLPSRGTASVEVILSGAQAARLRRHGVELVEHKALAAPPGEGVFRPYSGPGGLAEELRTVAQQHPDRVKLESIGKTVQGRDILAVKVTKDAATVPDGARPGTFYFGAQHAREWITPEMTRRLMHHFIDDYGTDPVVTSLVDSTELWFLPVANPDGYDFTFSGAPGARLWRKNLRDNNGDGKIAVGDGVDLNRNFGYRFGWDNEGSSPDQASDLYRGPAGDSEPETKAFNAFEQRVHPRFAINYHSAAQVMLYGVGWQTATATPDDVMYSTLTGDPAHPAVPGVRPQVVSDISTSNGDSVGASVNVNHVPMIAEEMESCQAVSASDPTDQWNPADCGSSFQFPDDEKLIQAEYLKSLPFAMSVARSAPNPQEPVSSLGITAAPFTPHGFTTSYADGAAQTVAVTARKNLSAKRVHYRINGGAEYVGTVGAWKGGKVYGGTDNLYYDEYRGQIAGAKPGSTVEVWFTGCDGQGQTLSSTHFSYAVANPADGDTLVLADEGAPAKNTKVYVDALAAAGHPNAAVWDVASQGAPDALAVLGHFASVVWEVGSHAAAAPTTIAVRDFMNEGGKLIKTGANAGVNEPLNVTQVNVDDFSQYWLGADAPVVVAGATGFTGAGRLTGANATFTGTLGQGGLFASISDSLPAAQFPQFASVAAGAYSGVTGPFEPFQGTGFAALRHGDNEYARLTRTADLSGATAAQQPQLSFALSYDTEPGFDHVVVEAHTVGQDDWTTLPDGNGRTDTGVPLDCVRFVQEHPFVAHYLTPNATSCTATGTSGAWNRATGSSSGWQRVTVDLSAYAGRQVELSITYLSDGGGGGRGAFVDDARLIVGGTTVDTSDFETGLGPWTAAAAPAGSPGNVVAWTRSGALLHSSAAISTGHSLLLGFGLESVPAPDQRATVLRKALTALG